MGEEKVKTASKQEHIKKEDDLLVQSVFDVRPFSKKPFSYIRYSKPIQGRPFRLGVDIKNISKLVFPGGTIKNAKYQEAKGYGLVHDIENEFAIPSLNPGDSTTIWLETCRTDIAGLCWFSMSIAADSPDREIVTFQLDDVTGSQARYKSKNEWGNSFRITEEHQVAQQRTNKLIALLTAIIVWESLFGLYDSLTWLSHQVASILRWFADILG